MNPHVEHELWSHAHAALDAGRRPLDDKAVLETLEGLLATDEAAPELRDWIAELAALEVALDTPPRLSKPRLWRRPRVLQTAAAAALLLITAVFWPRADRPALPTPIPVQIATSPAPIRPAPRATIKALEVTIRRQDAPIHLAGQSLQTTTTRTLHKPR